jgi:hypothetical protein
VDDFARQPEEHGGEAYVRALLLATDDGWTLDHLWALVGADPPDWQETNWRCSAFPSIGRSAMYLTVRGSAPTQHAIGN